MRNTTRFSISLILPLGLMAQSGFFGSKVSAGGSVATPSDSPGAGTYSGTQSVTLSDGTAGATICYTTDGSTPGASTPGTCNSSPTQTYSTAISVATTTTIKAIGTKSGLTNSGVLSSTYTIATPPAFSTCANGDNGGASTTSQATGTVAVSAGNLIYCVVSYQLNCSAATLTVDDSAGTQNVLSSVNAAFDTGNGVCSQSFYKANANAAASDVITAHATSSVPQLSLVCAVITGANTSTPLDAHPTTAEAVASSVTSNAWTTTSAAEIEVTGLATNSFGGSFTPDTGWTMPGACISAATTSAIQYKTVTSTQTGVTTTVGFSAARVFHAQPVTFKP